MCGNECECQCDRPERINGKELDQCTISQIRDCHPEFYNRIAGLLDGDMKGKCEHSDKMQGAGREDCTLSMTKRCHPELYEKIMNMWKEERGR